MDLAQLGLFGSTQAPANGPGDGVLKALEEFALEVSTPLEALNAIARWKSELKKKKG